MLFDMQMHVYSESVFNTLYMEIKQMLKKFSSDKINGKRYALSLLLQASAHHSFTFNLRFLCEVKGIT